MLFKESNILQLAYITAAKTPKGGNAAVTKATPPTKALLISILFPIFFNAYFQSLN